jgi:hypothetical protein
MKKLTFLLRVIATLQLILGIGYLLFPGYMLQSIGHSLVQPDIYYPLGMLAARFIACGIAFYIISSAPARYILWINFMVLVQVIDLGVGLFYTATGVLSLSLSAFPMFNAAWIIILLTLWRPRQEGVTT